MTPRKDPKGRKRAMLEVAAQEMVANGYEALTHRRVAELAGVPLGATTYYFTSLHELRTSALQVVVEQCEEELREIAQAVQSCRGSAEGIAAQFASYLSDRARLQAENLLYYAGVTQPELRPFAQLWIRRITEILSEYTAPEAAQATAVYLDGVILHALLHDRPIDEAALRMAIAALMSTSLEKKP
ncbi:TetR/AcrR family transcriptional regulator [Nocardiopsis ansamitocini]|uniref:DNA-binding transcriptional regulator n=1 Tax=Nocardiopsis ansamitocini TaxID=1670832 RepID=A0A9W6ULD8_9ACTN|nr:TetR family transcriptional regulator [Nocardiopsis ansamitocini]GLU49985.1 DNA-binding transcriptional regulator [Nocardiopsis ansamitocini]